jgi:hypothetical protein
MAALQEMLREHHRYAPIFCHAYKVLAGHPDPDMVSICLVVDKNKDQCRYNLPGRHVDQVAVILPGDGSQPVKGQDIVLRYRDGSLDRISKRHPAYTCLHYVLIWWKGTNGWHEGLQQHDPSQTTPKRLSQERFYAHQLFEWPNSFSIVLHSGRLFQQYAVDIWASVKQNRVNWLRFNQSQIWASLYSGLQDHIQLRDEVDLNDLGQRIVLPSLFTGSPRYMQQKFQDAMAIARFYKKIGIFATMTANPNWPEILQVLNKGETPADRPDIVSQVFQLKKKALMEDLIKRGVLGRVVAHIHTIKFQKRGLLHMHLLIFFADRDQIHEPADVDQCIQAYWPDPETEPELFETVKRCMVHGPCGPYGPGAPCMENGKCAKGFPKAFQEHTNMDCEGYPLYHHPDDGRSYEVWGHMLDNWWIVPYNPYLLHRFNCHINIETSVTFHSVKYITKYIHKGPDRATLEVTDHDEIKRFINSRYVSAPEAVWRLLEFDLHAHFPTVIQLQVNTFTNVLSFGYKPVSRSIYLASIWCFSTLLKIPKLFLHVLLAKGRCLLLTLMQMRILALWAIQQEETHTRISLNTSHGTQMKRNGTYGRRVMLLGKCILSHLCQASDTIFACCCPLVVELPLLLNCNPIGTHSIPLFAKHALLKVCWKMTANSNSTCKRLLQYSLADSYVSFLPPC